ncbi:ROK family protein [Populibacterium corticicola]|uniref:ROK family protein n=1 Tax=Populibacterium corticicola TaxID=1812826 RepID=A0ABW5XJ00_9MICO
MNAKPPTVGSQSSLREQNRSRIIDAIKQFGGLTQIELAGATGLSAATVSNIVKELTAHGVVNTSYSIRSGRRAQQVTLARTPGVIAALQFGIRSMRVALADTSGTIVTQNSQPLGADHRADAGLDRAALLIADMLETVDADPQELIGLSIALPAPVNLETGQISSPGILRGWDNVRVADVMAERMNKPVWVANASNMGALGELRAGAALGAQNALYIQAGQGIGAGLIINGQLFWGANGSAGEFGHMTVNPDGAICRCGNRGCLETEAGASVLLDSLRVSHGVLTLKDLLRHAMEGDLGCSRVISDAGRKIGLAAANLGNVFNPERIIVGGELTQAGTTLLDPIREAIARYSLPGVADAVQVVPGKLGADAELTGAIHYALSRAEAANLLNNLAAPATNRMEDQ